MTAALAPAPAQRAPTGRVAGEVALPAAVRSAVWRADEMGSPVVGVIPSGFDRLDAELPAGGWPRNSITEILQPQPTTVEWRLLVHAVRAVCAAGQEVVLIGPPKHPHAIGLQQLGLDERRLVWLKAETPAERLWTTEQLVKNNAAGLVVAWLPQARQEQIRRLQVCAQGCEGPVFLCRPEAAQHEPSAAPLRVHVRFGLDWQLLVRVVKRKGPTHDEVLELTSIPGRLESIMTPRLRRPSTLLDVKDPTEVPYVVDRAAAERRSRTVAAH